MPSLRDGEEAPRLRHPKEIRPTTFGPANPMPLAIPVGGAAISCIAATAALLGVAPVLMFVVGWAGVAAAESSRLNARGIVAEAASRWAAVAAAVVCAWVASGALAL